MSTLVVISDNELEKAAVDLKIKRDRHIQEKLTALLKKVNEEAKYNYARGKKSFNLFFNNRYSELKENEPIFQNFKKDFLKNNPAVRDIRIFNHRLYENGLRFYFSNPKVENTFTVRLLKPLSYLRKVFASAGRKQLSDGSQPNTQSSQQTRAQRAQDLLQTLTTQTTQIKDTELRETMNGVRTRLEETAKLTLDETRQKSSYEIDSKFGTYLNELDTLTRAMSVFLDISKPSDDDTMTLKSVIENTDTFASDFRSNIETTRDNKARLELNVIATVQKLNGPL